MGLVYNNQELLRTLQDNERNIIATNNNRPTTIVPKNNVSVINVNNNVQDEKRQQQQQQMPAYDPSRLKKHGKNGQPPPIAVAKRNARERNRVKQVCKIAKNDSFLYCCAILRQISRRQCYSIPPAIKISGLYSYRESIFIISFIDRSRYLLTPARSHSFSIFHKECLVLYTQTFVADVIRIKVPEAIKFSKQPTVSLKKKLAGLFD